MICLSPPSPFLFLCVIHLYVFRYTKSLVIHHMLCAVNRQWRSLQSLKIVMHIQSVLITATPVTESYAGEKLTVVQLTDFETRGLTQWLRRSKRV
jgi:hypothetical protein